MKSFSKIFGLLGFLISISAQSQELAPEASIIAPKLYSSLLEVKFFSANIAILNEKFANYGFAEVKYSESKVTLSIHKRPQSCPPNLACIDMLPPISDEVSVIDLPVAKFGSDECHDLYYAKTPDNAKSAIYEQMVIKKFVAERCPTLVAQGNEGSLYYRILAPSKKSGVIIMGEAGFLLHNTKVLNGLPTE